MGERAEEIRLLRTVGARPPQLTRAVCWETLIVTCVGTLLGTAIAAASLTALCKAATGRAWFAYSLPQYAGLVLVCAVTGLAGHTESTAEAATARRLTSMSSGGTVSAGVGRPPRPLPLFRSRPGSFMTPEVPGVRRPGSGRPPDRTAHMRLRSVDPCGRSLTG
ncbi:FtsX-like permease family protein [Sphaerisporangium fuscum]|uniref:FtsX-like permease family protein n=1 Tax=Sphaerisporangium fuscum TaxID=2835868 RepID=UPI003556A96B